MSISIIIVTWNNQNVIKNCLESILKFTIQKQTEVIIVDNNSDDSTVDFCNQYVYRMRLKVFALKENLGFARANNYGAEKASGDFILLLNPDTVLIEEGLGKLTSYFLEDPNVGIIGAKLLNADFSLQPSMFCYDSPINIIMEQFMIGRILPYSLQKIVSPYLTRHDNKQFCDWLVGAFLLISKEDYLMIDGFSEIFFMYSEDMEICYKVNKQLEKKVMFIPDYSIIHLGGVSEKKDIHSSKQEKMFLSRKRFAGKYALKLNMRTFYFCYSIKYFLSNVFRNHKKVEYYKDVLSILNKIK